MNRNKFKQTEIGIIPEDWEVASLEEYADFITGKLDSNASEINGKYPFFTCAPLPLKINNFAFDCEAVLLAGNNANGIFHLNYYKGKFNAYQRTYVITPKDKNKLNLKYLKYQLNLRLNYLKEISQGTATKFLTMRILNGLNVVLPNIEEQSAIAKILSDLDTKIELNQQMNKTLEAIGQAIFKRWFINFEFQNEKGKPYKSSGGEMVYNEELDKEIPKSWYTGYLGNIIRQIKHPLKEGESIKNRRYVPINLLSMRTISILSYLSYNEAKSSLIGFEKDDILVGAMRVYFHRVNLAPFLGVTRATTFVLRPIRKELLSYSLLLLNQDETINYANAHSKGSTMPYAVWGGSLEKMTCLIPTNKTIEEFHNLIYPMISKIRDSLFNVNSLSQIRDSLLPRLMSGKIRVPVEVRA